MPIDQPLTEDPRFKDNFPWQMNISNKEFMLWTVGKFQYCTRIDGIDGKPVPYYLIRFPAMNPAEDNWRFTICPHFSQEPKRDIERNIARLYDISKLMQQSFPNKETHPVVHKHETALYLLKEAKYVHAARTDANALDRCR